MAGVGLETRREILPQPSTPEDTPGIFGPDYSVADNVPLPGDVGVRDGDGLGDVVDAVKGAAFYVDMIGFGESSNPLTRGMNVRPLGVNTWMRTGMKCSNGADMWSYMEGIPKGDSVGVRVQKGLKSAGLPGLRGMAPGMLEDAKEALNPVPILKSVFGTGYPSCRLEARRVGDQDGVFQNPETKKYFVEDPNTVFCSDNSRPEGGRCKSGVPMQKRWVQEKNITKAEWDAVPKTHCPDGLPVKNHYLNRCDGRVISLAEGFEEGAAAGNHKDALTTLVAGGVAIGILLAVVPTVVRCVKN